MKRLLSYADQYLQKSDWTDLGMIKCCLFSIGILAGTYIPEKKKEYARITSLIVFVVTYVIVMAKFFDVITERQDHL